MSGQQHTDKQHFTHGTSASTADMAADGKVRSEDKDLDAPHSRVVDPLHCERRGLIHLDAIEREHTRLRMDGSDLDRRRRASLDNSRLRRGGRRPTAG